MRKIVHLDMDSFFAAVEERDNPAFRGKPVAVGGMAEQRGVIFTANYVARKFGVRSAMSSAKAKLQCPKLILLPPRIKQYQAVSSNIMDICKRYTDLAEPVSLDEVFLDVSSSAKCYGSATWIAQEIRDTIYQDQGLTASAGISINKFLAKVASDWNKPNGQYVIPPSAVAEFIARLAVEKIFGVGLKTAAKMHRLGITTCSDLQKLNIHAITSNFGDKYGNILFNLCRGVDQRAVNPNRKRKSLSIEKTFATDLATSEHCQIEIVALINELQRRLRNLGEHEHGVKTNSQRNIKFHKIFVKLKFADFFNLLTVIHGR